MSVSETIKNHPEMEGTDPRQVLDLLWAHDVAGVSLVSLDGHWIHPSPLLCEWLGYTKDQLERMTWMDITIRTDRKEDIEATEAVLRGEIDSYVMFKTYIRRNETLMPATLAVVPIKDSTNKVIMFLSQVERDIREVQAPPIDELRVVANFLKGNKKTIMSAALLYTIAIALAGDGALRWLQDVLSSFTSFGLSGN
jgi:PAS domain S-box-containing protein